MDTVPSPLPRLPRIVMATRVGPSAGGGEGSGGESAARRFVEFFTVSIRNPNTRRAYYRAACKFLDFAKARGVPDLRAVQPMLVAAWVEAEQRRHEPQTVKQELAAVRMLFDWLVVGQVLPMNPASAVLRDLPPCLPPWRSTRIRNRSVIECARARTR